MGGLPWWLVKHDQIGLRSRDPKFLEPAVRYLKEVGRVLGPMQVTHGGPLLMVQVENEYGSFGRDAEYMGVLRKALIDSGFDVPLFACNPGGDIGKGYRDDLFQVVNFGRGGAPDNFNKLSKYRKTGPLMNGEYYPGWFDTWGKPRVISAKKPEEITRAILGDMSFMLDRKYSFSLYMAHGGTTFGMWSGTDQPFKPDTSSYDYGAPISEAGWVTPLYDSIRDLFAKHLQPGESIPNPPAANPVITFPTVELSESAPIFANLPDAKTDSEARNMEAYGQGRGCILYRTTLPPGPAGVLALKKSDKAALEAVHDFAWVRLDGRPVGVMDRRSSASFSVKLPARTTSAQLDILVEAVGRVNFGSGIYDRKGITTPVFFTDESGNARRVTDWKIYSLPLDDRQLSTLKYTSKTAESSAPGPAFWRGSFSLDKPGDTFLDLRTWGKGVVWINGHCLARFWNIGPTQTAYVPGPWLKAGRNEVVIWDLTGPEKPVVAGLAKPILEELHPEKDISSSVRAKGTVTLPSRPALTGTFTPEVQWQSAKLAKPVTGRYVAFEALSAHTGKDVASAAEFGVLGVDGEPLPNAAWRVIWVDSEERPGDVDNMLDGQSASSWQTAGGGKAPFPHRFVIDLGDSKTIGGVRYLPRGGGANEPGRIKDWRLFIGEQPFGLKP
jgi:beta-galactosidase